jgi:hypothetical protein
LCICVFFTYHMFYFTVIASSQLSEGDEFYHQIANWGLYMAEGVFGLVTVAVAKITLWPPLQYYLREKWDWPSRSKGKPPYSSFILKIKILFSRAGNKKSSKHPHDEEEARDHSSSDEAGGPATGVRCNRCSCEHESAPIGFKKPRNPRPSATSEIHHDTVSEGFQVTLNGVNDRLPNPPPQKKIFLIYFYLHLFTERTRAVFQGEQTIEEKKDLAGSLSLIDE